MRRLITAPAAMRAPLPSPPPGRPTVCRDKVASLHADRHDHRCGDIVFYPEGPPPTRPPKQPTGASQQAQGRQAHYETIGRVLFGLAPDTVMFTSNTRPANRNQRRYHPV